MCYIVTFVYNIIFTVLNNVHKNIFKLLGMAAWYYLYIYIYNHGK